MINIQIDQVGYRPNDYKTATFRIEDTNSVSDSVNLTSNLGSGFRVIDVINNEVIFEGELSEEIKSEPNGEINRVGDFSSLLLIRLENMLSRLKGMASHMNLK